MVNFVQAAKWMKEGKKVRRKSTSNSEWYIYLSQEKGEKDFVYLHHMKGVKDKIHNFNMETFEATDWEIYEEKKEYLFEGKLEFCRESEFYGIDCLESDTRFGFFGYYNGDKNHPDPRPGHAIWLKKDDAEHLFELFHNLNERGTGQ